MHNTNSFFEYIRQLETKEGGFSIGQLVPPSIDDTYFAVMSILILVKYSNEAQKYYTHLKKNKKLLRYLKDYTMPPTTKIKLAYRYISLCKVFNIEGPAYRYRDQDDGISIEDLYYIRLMERLSMNEVLYEETVEDLKSGIEENSLDIMKLSSFAHDPIKGKYIDTVYQASFLFYRYWIEDKRKRSELHDWFRMCQNPDGGYGFYPRTTSYMDNCYWAYKAYKVFGITPTYPEKLLDFILSCRTKTGGLGRRNGTVPSPEYTYYGLCWLEVLEKGLSLKM